MGYGNGIYIIDDENQLYGFGNGGSFYWPLSFFADFGEEASFTGEVVIRTHREDYYDRQLFNPHGSNNRLTQRSDLTFVERQVIDGGMSRSEDPVQLTYLPQYENVSDTEIDGKWSSHYIYVRSPGCNASSSTRLIPAKYPAITQASLSL